MPIVIAKLSSAAAVAGKRPMMSNAATIQAVAARPRQQRVAQQQRRRPDHDPQPGQAGGNADHPVVAAELRDRLFRENEDEPSVTEYRQPAQPGRKAPRAIPHRDALDEPVGPRPGGSSDGPCGQNRRGDAGKLQKQRFEDCRPRAEIAQPPQPVGEVPGVEELQGEPLYQT